ncbi:hypothetical protein [Deinococcus navajonensis]|uniref:Uncharacterized protein n=1 Tax=Deinococcus navajonensis TaxID=309884 RepID=A0ABV8XR27_9DEIO
MIKREVALRGQGQQSLIHLHPQVMTERVDFTNKLDFWEAEMTMLRKSVLKPLE